MLEQQDSAGSAGTKRKAIENAASSSKKGKKTDGKEQQTLEEALKPDESTDSRPGENDVTMQDPEDLQEAENVDAEGAAPDDQATASEEKPASKPTDNGDEKVKDQNEDTKPNGFEKLMDQESKAKENDKTNGTAESTGSKVDAADNAVETSSKREEAMPSSILEKGIIYFFFRGRVGVTEPTNVADIARSYMILRPLPQGAKLGEGPIGDEKNNRLLALPKKVLPASPKDRFMVFVEKANASMDEIKETLSSSDYATKTAGVRHTPAATPIGEGVYAITHTGRDTHLAYILTIPDELEAVQKGVGLRKRGSYFTSAKNPESSSPANASLPQGADYPKEIIDEFHGRGWMPLQPKLLNYENSQFLIIGHGDDALEKATKAQDGEEEEPEVETPLEEVEKLEKEDELRVEHLDGTLETRCNHPSHCTLQF